jgi:hypothetical protein
MNTAQDFLRRAALAEQAAQAVDHLGYRDRMLSIARTWREKAMGCCSAQAPNAPDGEPQDQVLSKWDA